MLRVLRWLLRFTPIPGARECRVPGWRLTACDTTRLEQDHVGWVVAVPPKTGRSQNGTLWFHGGTAESCQHPACRHLRDSAYARALNEAAAPPASSNDGA